MRKLYYKNLAVRDREHLGYRSLEIALKLIASEQFSEAIEVLEPLCRHSLIAIQVAANFNLGIIELQRTGQLTLSAKNYFSTAIKLDRPNVLATLDFLCRHTESFKVAEDLCHFMLQQTLPNEVAVSVLVSSAELSAIKNEVEAMQESLEQAYAYGPEILWSQVNKVLSARVSKENLQVACALYEGVLALFPDEENLYLQLGARYQEAMDFENAISCYEDGLKHFPEHVLLLADLAEAYDKLNDQSHMIEIREHLAAIPLEEYKKQDPVAALIYYRNNLYYLGLNLLACHANDQALFYLQALYHHDPNWFSTNICRQLAYSFPVFYTRFTRAIQEEDRVITLASEGMLHKLS